jgi:hypothetical protein
MQRNPVRSLVASAFALAALAAAGIAQARDNVYWSVGVDAAPGVSLGVSNTRPVVVTPAPVYVTPQPVYVAPAPVYVAPRPVYVQPQRELLVQSAPVYVHPGKHKGWHKRHHRHRHHD